MSDYPKRHWGLRGFPRSGKSVFLSANAERPLYMIDADGRFDFVKGMAPGQVIYPTSKKGHILPVDIQEQAEVAVLLGDIDIKSIGIDSVTQVFSYQSRLASMRGNMSAAERKQRNLGKNKAADMVEKSNAMAVLRTIASFGTNVFYVWHLTEGRDSRGVEEVRDVISKIELDRLYATMAAIMDFTHEQGGYYVTVTWARDLNGKPANTGFTLQDAPGNFWRGGGLRLERCMYTTFEGEKEAIEWAMEKLGKGGYDEIQAHWQDITRKYREWPVKVAMWVDDIYGRLDKAQAPIKQAPPPKQVHANGTDWAEVEPGTAVKITGKKGVVDGLFQGVNGALLRLEIDGEEYNLSPEKVALNAQEEVSDGTDEI